MSSKSATRNRPPSKKGVSRGRRPKAKDPAVGDIISKVQNTPTAYREGGRTKRATRSALLLKKLVNGALEGDTKSAEELLKLRAKARKSGGARSQKIIVEDWIPDFEGQTGEQKTRAHAQERPTVFSEQTGSKTTDSPASVSVSPKNPRNE